MSNNDNEASAQKLEPFSNPVTGWILAIILALGAIGLYQIVKGSLIAGIILMGLGGAIFIFGYTELPPKPRTAGVLTLWGSFFKLNGNPVVVGGTTVLANYFPFYLSCVQVDATNRDKDIPMKITSLDNAVLEGIVSITIYVEFNDIIDFIQAGGNMDDIIKQLDDIIVKKTREIASLFKALDITKNTEFIERKLTQYINTKIEQKEFGVKLLKVQAVFDQSSQIVIAMEQALVEKYERKNEVYEYETNLIAAKKLQEEYRKDPEMVRRGIPTLQECKKEILEQRLIRDQKMTGISSKGGKVIPVVKTP